jgi:hypothetical protein
MTINPQSRYNLGTVVRMPNAGGTYNLSVLRTIPQMTASYTLYIWKQTDRPDIVASRLLGNSSLWWAIFDINPELIYPLNIPAGTLIRIPKGPVMGQGTLMQ